MLSTALLLCLFLGPQEAPASAPAKDPFQPAEDLARALGERRAASGEFRPLDDRPQLPAMKLKGTLKMKSKASPAAAIQVEGAGSYVVREGGQLAFSIDAVSLRPSRVAPSPAAGAAAKQANGALAQELVREQLPIALRVQRITADGVLVEVGTLGTTLIIR